MKSYTDLEQSKKLAEILSLESADMHYCLEQRDVITGYEIGITPYTKAKSFVGKCNIVDVKPAWSLAALLNLCPTINEKQPILTRGKITRLWYCYYEDETDTQTYDNSVDAVFEMIQLLHEQKLL